jgi:hypothetical protein
VLVHPTLMTSQRSNGLKNEAPSHETCRGNGCAWIKCIHLKVRSFHM